MIARSSIRKDGLSAGSRSSGGRQPFWRWRRLHFFP